MKALILTFALIAAAGCSSTRSAAVEHMPEGVVLLSEEGVSSSSKGDRAYGNLRQSFLLHVEDCRTGLDFTMRAFSRNFERSRERLRWLFE